jgi:curved DNA-binding protein CbpA
MQSGSAAIAMRSLYNVGIPSAENIEVSRASMSTCMCGNPVDTIGNFCSRCGALQTLGLGSFASAAEIESTYMTLVRVWHPDRFQSDPKLRQAAEEKLKEINAAHDYLNSGPRVANAQPFTQEPEPVPEPEAQPVDAVFSAEPVIEESEEVKRVLKRLKKRSGSKIFIKVAFTLGGVAVCALLWISIDFFLSANQTTARPWEELKAEFSRDLHSTGERIFGGATETVQGSKQENALPPAPVVPQQGEPAKAPPPRVGTLTKTRPPAAANGGAGAKPYLTSGLTPMEVISILGNPTSSSGERMFYQGSEIDFRNGQVAGWKIDSKSPIRVKLWPNRPLAPGTVAFSIGSPKSDVIALQGTPNVFSDNEFHYGGSVVFFQNDRVISWKEDPASVPLQVAH